MSNVIISYRMGIPLYIYFIRTCIHLQVDMQTMLMNLPQSSTVYVQKNELDPVGATNILRGLAAKIKFVDRVARNGENVKKKLSDFDADYMNAVNHGDIKTTQKMVDDAAKAAGYTTKAYHGTDAASFNVFDRGRIGTSSGLSILGDGFYFSDKRATANQYGRNVYSVYLKQSNPYAATSSDAYKLKPPKT